MRRISSSSSKAFGFRTLDGEHADQPILDEQRKGELALPLGKTGKSRRVTAGRDVPRRLHTRPDAPEVGDGGPDVADAHHAFAVGDDAEDAVTERNLGSDAARVVAAAGEDAELRLGEILEQHHRVLEAEHSLHGAQDDRKDLVEIERGGDLRGDLLDDPNLVKLLREVAVQPVDRLLILSNLLPEPGESSPSSGVGSFGGILRGADDAIDVGGAKLEDPLQTDHRGDRLDLHVHHLEDRPFRLRAVVLDL